MLATLNPNRSSTETFYTPTVNGVELVTAYHFDTFDFAASCGNYDTLRSKHSMCINQFATFDIETYSKRDDEPYAWMYHWQMCVNGTVVFGRRWEEFMYLLKRISEYYKTDLRRRFIIYVHNLSYEFQFIKSFFEWHDVFMRKEHSIIKAVTVNGIEFRCSYLLSNCSLDLFLKNCGALHRKVKAESIDDDEGYQYDYELFRTADTELSDKDKGYCYNDVKGPYEAIEYLLKEDTLLTIPLTSTSYVRRDMRAALQSSKYKRFIRKMSLTLDQYEIAKEAFRGGDTHAQYHIQGVMLEDIEANDISSSYPYVIMTKKFPMSPFQKADQNQFETYFKAGKLMMFRLRLEGVSMRDIWDMPYISYSKCRNVKGARFDNGRILSCKSLEISVTELDYRIITDVYKIKAQYISDLYICDGGYLPTPIREVTLEYFRRKTELKNEISKLKALAKQRPLTNDELETLSDMLKNYVKAKNKLNGIYGMFATDPVRENWIFTDLKGVKQDVSTEEALEGYYSKYSTFLCYQWGIWVTAWARYRLHEIRCLKRGSAVYNDTDSVYAPKEFTPLITAYNEKVKDEIMKAPIPPYVDVDGKRYYMGTVEPDGKYRRFITWGCKRYAVETETGEIKITVAGLSKTGGAEQLKKDGLEAFKPGWRVENSGNMAAYYNDKSPHYIEEEGCRMLTGSNVAMFSTPYELNPTREYKDLIGYIQNKDV